MNELTNLLSQLIAIPSVTPLDEGCQAVMCKELKDLGFRIYHFPCAPVDNFYAEFGIEGPRLVFAGHTDVVSPGDLKDWETEPFTPTIKDEMFYGRGAADMKGSLAAMLIAARHFVKNKNSKGRLGFLITSAEEGDAFDKGTPYVMEQLDKEGIAIDYCIVGEPSSTSTLGDVVKIGRRGSLTGDVTVTGTQGHVAYPHLADNPIHQAASSINELCQTAWDEGNEYFPPTTFQISNINAGTGAGNVIPGSLKFKFNFRYSTETSDDFLKKQVEAIFKKHDVQSSIKWRLNGIPFLTGQGRLVTAVTDAIQESLNISTELSTTGGTSDGRFIAPYGVEVVELGPVNATIHKANECVNLSELLKLATLYQSIAEKLLC